MAIKWTLPIILVLACILVMTLSKVSGSNNELPTAYQYFTEGGINSGLVAEDTGEFRLNGKLIRVISGAIHYFRVPKAEWRNSLRKLRATGANTVETYVAWNLHEPRRGQFDFGEGHNDMSEFLDLRAYLQMAQEEDLFVLLRPGPYICTEWEFGGFPSWLLRDFDMTFRGSYPGFLNATKAYFDELLIRRLANMQFVRGGPIIGVQMENEYGYFDSVDKVYLEFLVNVTKEAGYDDTLLFTSDGSWVGGGGSLPELLWTVNFGGDAEGRIEEFLQNHQPNKPIFVMEFWIGWFSMWFENSIGTGQSVEELRHNFEYILAPPQNGSVNFYIFQGGTNFGFMAGGPEDHQMGKITSYDYYGALSESGDYTEKYNIISELLDKYAMPQLAKPTRPLQNQKEAYDSTVPQLYLNFNDILNQVPPSSKFQHQVPTSMEMLDMNDGNGQSYGYIHHQFVADIRNGSVLKAGIVKDFGIVLIDGVVQPQSFAGDGQERYWIRSEREVALQVETDGPHTISILVENMGRVNGGPKSAYSDRKGLHNGHIALDGVNVTNFDVFALEFTTAWVQSLTDFKPVNQESVLTAPIVVQSTFEVREPLDTWVDLTTSGWHKGIIFINGFNIGRYFKAGPQQRLFVSHSFLTTGTNTITIFEQLEVGTDIKFRATPDTP